MPIVKMPLQEGFPSVHHAVNKIPAQVCCKFVVNRYNSYCNSQPNGHHQLPHNFSSELHHYHATTYCTVTYTETNSVSVKTKKGLRGALYPLHYLVILSALSVCCQGNINWQQQQEKAYLQ